MRVLYLITKAELGGAQIHLLDLLKGFHPEDEVVLGVGDRGFLTDEAEALGIRCHVTADLVHQVNLLQDAKGVLAIRTLIDSVQPDLVHVHTSKAGLLGRVAAKISGAPVIFTAHTWPFTEGTSWKWKALAIPAESIAGRLASLIINVSDANRQLACRLKIAPEEKLITVHNGVPDTPHRAEPGSGDPVVLMVARFAPQKDQMLLLNAVSQLATRPTIQFVGDGETRLAVEAEAERLGMKDRVQFLGNRTDIPELMAKAHVFALCSKWEGFPLTILEAMRAGLPVIASRVGGVPESVIDGQNGFLVEPSDLSQLAVSVKRLIDDPLLRMRMGAAGRALYEERFTVTAMLHKTRSAYEQVLQKQ